ncbi:hypothetical protein B0H14DRAFT_3140614 [Mycena olivaceomarginata]|nr:hypothetical protein B0H14DRAFT_3140614 [Mycena olivaceomarginata]
MKRTASTALAAGFKCQLFVIICCNILPKIFPIYRSSMRVISLISVASALVWATSAAPVEESGSSSHEPRLRQDPSADRKEAEISDLDARSLWAAKRFEHGSEGKDDRGPGTGGCLIIIGENPSETRSFTGDSQPGTTRSRSAVYPQLTMWFRSLGASQYAELWKLETAQLSKSEMSEGEEMSNNLPLPLLLVEMLPKNGALVASESPVPKPKNEESNGRNAKWNPDLKLCYTYCDNHWYQWKRFVQLSGLISG